jgi:chromosome partition protein MukE
MSEPFSQIGDVVLDESFPAVDLALRRGRHIHKGDERWYALLFDAQLLLEQFYGRYGYELVHRSDGYFFLLPANEALGKRQLSVAEMIVGQGLALAYLEPSRLEKGGLLTREELINQLASTMGTDALLHALAPQKKRPDERVAQRNARNKVAEALRRLEQLGFVELLTGEELRLAPSLLRFAEPVRGLEAPSEALRKLLARGELSLGADEAEAEPEPEPELGADDSEFEPEPQELVAADTEGELPLEAVIGLGAPLYDGSELDFFEEPPSPAPSEADDA